MSDLRSDRASRPRPMPHADWHEHELRNACNTAGLAAAMARSALERGDTELAARHLARVERACERAVKLFDEQDAPLPGDPEDLP